MAVATKGLVNHLHAHRQENILQVCYRRDVEVTAPERVPAQGHATLPQRHTVTTVNYCLGQGLVESDTPTF